ncbi:Crp/Fnr family transcriptional regulator [Jannaschia seohaensis]|uniref:CRP-like cAMP-binding protein n=1 Tax=Jannaschia seohaensis TaxID=475081 RepID=A0A2Y9AEB7_9RHOB|nr:Crp/Fnr family transcriptional regulator [Jannaschia seohaensis]PWJ21208.1 CRP-like cAMP-binding protein [Jannaschia seohaensis]SSA41618.1 cAMP-binding domain of CRP or a regulatory subunit of cAMP-dependent protein kinases [Jannaschia seohaensis]
MTACAGLRELPAGAVLSRRGHPIPSSQLLLDGLIGRSVPGADGSVRQMVALQVPGDFVDLHSFPQEVLDHDVIAITPVTVAAFPNARLRELIAGDHVLAMALWELTTIDATIHWHWSFRMGALRARAAVANFLCEMELRLRLADRSQGGQFRLPMTQSDIGEACGMTSVHVSRMLRELRQAGLCTVESGRVTIHDHDGLRRMGRFDPQFLHLGKVTGFSPD